MKLESILLNAINEDLANNEYDNPILDNSCLLYTSDAADE